MAPPLPRFPGYDDLDEEELLFPMVYYSLMPVPKQVTYPRK